MAFQHTDDHLKLATLGFVEQSMNADNFNSLFGTREWFKFAANHDELARDIVKEVSKRIFKNSGFVNE